MHFAAEKVQRCCACYPAPPGNDSNLLLMDGCGLKPCAFFSYSFGQWNFQFAFSLQKTNISRKDLQGPNWIKSLICGKSDTLALHRQSAFIFCQMLLKVIWFIIELHWKECCLNLNEKLKPLLLHTRVVGFVLLHRMWQWKWSLTYSGLLEGHGGGSSAQGVGCSHVNLVGSRGEDLRETDVAAVLVVWILLHLQWALVVSAGTMELNKQRNGFNFSLVSEETRELMGLFR